MLDIITFGSATQDIMVRPKKLTNLKYERAQNVPQVCFPMGGKIDVDEMDFYSGGGGTNTAATFAKQGFKTAFCGVVGDDQAGKQVLDELKRLKVDTNLVLKTKEKATNYSVIISSEGEDRTILAYRGASDLLDKNKILWGKIKSKWLYLAPLSGLLCDAFEDIVNFAFENKIKIAVNPGNSQLSLPAENLQRIFKKIDILILNQEEASFLTKISFREESEIFKKIDQMCPGVAIMTKGIEGAVAS